MYGYIYKTTLEETGEVYIGKKALPKFRPTYHGAGNRIKSWLKEYGDQGLVTVMLDSAETKDKLNRLEKSYIQKYKAEYRNKCINEAEGGDGGNVLKYADDITKDAFSTVMTQINRKRCKSDEFRNAVGKRMREKYSDPLEREKQSKLIKAAWSNEELRASQSKRLKEYYASVGGKDCSFNFKPCELILNGKSKKFKSTKDLKHYLKTELGISFPNPTLKALLDSEEPYHPFRKNKYAHLDGMVLRRCRD